MLHFTPLADIVIKSGRQRQEFDPAKMEELKNSIIDSGLMHAPVMRNEAGKLVLVAGETRLKVIEDIYALGETFRYNGQQVPAGLIPYVTLGELSPLAAEEAELDENLRRKDLTWQELANAHSKLHNLRKKQADAIRITHQDQSQAPAPHTIADTAREVHGRADGYFHDLMRQEIIVAQHLDNPEVAKAGSMKDAFKILKKQEETKKNIALGLAVGATFNSAMHQLHNVNCLDWMDDPANAGTIDVILTDPPYGMGADDFGDGAGRLSGIEHHYDDSYESWLELMKRWCPLSFAVTKPQAHAYIFCDIDRFHELKSMMQAAGWYVFRTPLINFKTNSGRVPLPDKGPRRQYEILLYAIKGGKLTTHIYPDVITSQADESMSHGAQKPVAVYANLLQRSVRPGDTVLDAFAGSGTIFPAAHPFKCTAIGLERSGEYYGMGLRRLQGLQEELK